VTRNQAYALFDRIKPNGSGCVYFLGIKDNNPRGYRYSVTIDQHPIKADRVALERKLKRPLHPGFHPFHCSNPSCINPAHLFEVGRNGVAA
jgi:hypothetical protein